MKITCDVCRDLQPLYADGLASPDSREAVREHLAGCEQCRRCYRSAAVRANSAPDRRCRTSGDYSRLASRVRNRAAALGAVALGFCAALILIAVNGEKNR